MISLDLLKQENVHLLPFQKEGHAEGDSINIALLYFFLPFF